jgi:hypothetical protein
VTRRFKEKELEERRSCRIRQNRWVKYRHHEYNLDGRHGTVLKEHCNSCPGYRADGSYPDSGCCLILIDNNPATFNYICDNPIDKKYRFRVSK